MTPACPGEADRARLEALYRTGLLDTPPEKDFDRLTELTCRLLHVPVALVSLVDEERQFFKSSQGLPEPWVTKRQTPLSHSFCQHVVSTKAPLTIADARDHPLVCDNLAIRDLNVVGYLGIPLLTPDGCTIGSLCAIDHKPRSWSEEDVAVLSELAALAIKEIELRFHLCQLHRAEQALQRRTEQLEQSNRELTQFTHMAAHDLGAPLQAIILFNDMLQKRYGARLDADGRMLMAKLGSSTLRMQTLLRDLLAYARAGPGHQRFEMMPVDLSALMGRVRENLEASILEEDALVQYEQLPTVLGEVTYLSLVFQNLLGNALKYRGAAPPRIHVSAARDVAGWRISVCDNGLGIAEEHREVIFEPFRRVHSQRAGSGIGLATCKRIVERHGGRIWVDSEPGQGSTFHLTLPAQKE